MPELLQLIVDLPPLIKEKRDGLISEVLYCFMNVCHNAGTFVGRE